MLSFWREILPSAFWVLAFLPTSFFLRARVREILPGVAT
jgi:hypothetical protein